MSTLPDTKQNPTLGIFFMVLTGLCFVAMTALVKWQAGHLPAIQTSFLRFLLGILFVLPAWKSVAQIKFTPRLLGLFTLRGVFHSCAVVCWFYSMTRIPIAEVTAMNHLNPVFITVMAAIFLGERLQTGRLLAVLVALLGAFIVLRPGFRVLDPGHITMLLTAAALAGSYLLAKVFSAEIGPAAVVAVMSVTVAVFLAPLAILHWQPIVAKDLIVLFAVAGLATCGHYLMSRALAVAPISLVQPVVFLQFVWSVILGALFFAEPVDPWVITGGALIIGAVVYNAIREARGVVRDRRRSHQEI